MTEDEQVRRLLADARHTEPMPDDVVARLDGVLADLHADRPVRPGVTDLAAARRRRRARGLLVAAAAVVVAGLAADQIRGAGGGDDSDSAASGGAASQVEDGGGAGREVAPESAERPSEHSDRADELEGGTATATTDGTALFQGYAFKLTPDDFGDKAVRLQRRQLDQRHLDHDAGAALDARAKARCAAGEWGAGRVVVVRYDGSLGALVYRAPRGDTQVADLYLCGRDEPTRSITLSAP